MKNIILFMFFTAVGLSGCKTAPNEPRTDILLSVSDQTSSKAGSLASGDEVTVFARMDGTEHYFLEGAKYVVGSDGHSLTYGSTVYYPETKQAIHFYAYFGGAWDMGRGTCSVPSDQSPATELKKADLCWATASTTPVPTPVSLTFQHLFARLIVQTNEPTSKIACLVVPSGVLNPATGQFVLGSDRKEVWTTGTELILPVQPLSRLVLAVSGVDYVFEGLITLQSGQTTTLNLTLNPSTKTATFNGSSTTNWNSGSVAGDPDAQVSNAFTMHYAPAPAEYAKADKVVLTVQHPVTAATQEFDLIPTLIAGQSAAKACGYTFALQLPLTSGIPYPYIVSRVRLYAGATLLRDTPQKYLKGANIYRSGAQTLAHYITIQVRDAATDVIDLTKWGSVMGGGGQQSVKVTVTGADTWTATATGVGVGTTASGANGAIGAIYWERNPSTTDGRSGSLTFETVPSGATVTIPTNQLAQATPPGTVLVNGVSICTGNLVADGPNGCKMGAPTDYGLYFKFGSLIGWSGGANGDGTGGSWTVPIALQVKPATYGAGVEWGDVACFKDAPVGAGSISFTAQPGGENNATTGIGDPCSFYLGANFRLPTRSDFSALFASTEHQLPWPVGGWVLGVPATIHTATGIVLPLSSYRIGDTGRISGSEAHYMSQGAISRTWASTLFLWGWGARMGGGIPRPDCAGPVRCVAN